VQTIIFIAGAAVFLSFYFYRYWKWIKYLAWKFKVLPLHEQITRQRSGLCIKCGYDIRATPRQCPECGTVQRISR
jgi:hypothetical protein